MATDMSELTSRAARADALQSELDALKRSTETFTVEIDHNDYHGMPDVHVNRIIEDTVGKKIGRWLMNHPGAINRITVHGKKRFIVKVILCTP